MDELTPDHVGEIAKVDAQPEGHNSGKEAWVTPVVREFDPSEVTKAFSGAAGTDAVTYS